MAASAVGWALLSRSTGPAAAPGPAAHAGAGGADEGAAAPAPHPAGNARPAVELGGTTPLAKAAVLRGASGPPGPAASGPRSARSPLERSPGYYPPEDPESLSVVTGRREAPAVDLEFTGGATSLRSLGEMIVAALNSRDEAGLHALRVTRREFEVILWREFPESRPVTNITADDAWEMSLAQSAAGAGRAIGLYGGRDLELLAVESRSTHGYRNFTLYRGVGLLVRERGTGEEHRLAIAPSVADRRGRFKALLFKD